VPEQITLPAAGPRESFASKVAPDKARASPSTSTVITSSGAKEIASKKVPGDAF